MPSVAHNPSIPCSPPQLVAPAGDGQCLRAAVDNGAEAVYFGLQTGFNARARAANFSEAELPEMVASLHRQQVKAFLTLNTLVFPGELEQVEQVIRAAAGAGVDALIVQDVGVARLAQAVCPDLRLHASTQMTLASAESIEAAGSLGLKRVVLPRELSLEQIAALHRQTGLELEVFVHGALCISYSGQCLASLALGGRSANRGLCAQPCRLPYSSGGSHGYLLSPHDLAAFDLVPRLMDAGVAALKIEGRMKSAQYVAVVTRCYRRAIDAAAAGRPFQPDAQELAALEVSFSRGFGHGWLEGPNPAALVSGRASAKRGTYLGEVRGVRAGRVIVHLVGPVKRGDGLVFAGDRAAGDEQGGRVFEVHVGGRPAEQPIAEGVAELAFGREAIDLARVRPGQEVWKTDDPALARRLRQSVARGDARRRVPLDLAVEAGVGRVLRIEGRAASGGACRVESPQALVEALRHPLTAELLREQLGRLGGTPYVLRNLEAAIEGRPMVPLSVLGKLRHEMVRQLEESAVRPAWTVALQPVLPTLRAALVPLAGPPGAVRLEVLCRSMPQLEAVLASGVEGVIADFGQADDYGEAVRLASGAGAEIYLATPRIALVGGVSDADRARRERIAVGDGSYRAQGMEDLARHRPDGILARNLAALAWCAARGIMAVADFSLNAANELTVAWLRERGAARVTASYDLDGRELLRLAANVPAEWLEVVIHQHMPMFHTEYPPSAFLLPPSASPIRLRDQKGKEHLVLADAEGRTTVFSAVEHSAALIVPQLVRRGVRHVRIELLDQEDPRPLVEIYRDLVAGRITGHEAWGRLRAVCPAGVSRGTMKEQMMNAE